LRENFCGLTVEFYLAKERLHANNTEGKRREGEKERRREGDLQ